MIVVIVTQIGFETEKDFEKEVTFSATHDMDKWSKDQTSMFTWYTRKEEYVVNEVIE